MRNKADGTTCDDDNPCTANDQCTSGVCRGTEVPGCRQCDRAADCPTPADQCQRAVCTAGGVCATEPASGKTCNDGNPCTRDDTCTAAGTCAGTPIPGCVECDSAADCATPSNPCEKAVCTGGVCTTEPDAGKACNDGNPCTRDDTCTAAGVCAGELIAGCVRCQSDSECSGIAVDQCQRAVCNQSTGTCEVTVNEGVSCNDRNPCTENDTCSAAGVCAGTQVQGCVVCSANSDCANVPTTDCTEAFCQANGTCGVRNKTDGTTCNDNNPCTENDRCAEGVCAGAQIQGCVLCSDVGDCANVPTTQCTEAFCQANGTCGIRNKTDGTACNDGNPCTENDSCTEGVCAGTQIQGCVLCSENSDCANIPTTECSEAFCQANGTCGIRNKTDGTACNDGNPCTENDSCTAGVCAGSQITGCVLCSENSDCATFPGTTQCTEAFCQANGTCGIRNKTDGTACNDNNPCTQNDSCTAGVCAGTQIQGCVLCTGNSDCATFPGTTACTEAFCQANGTCGIRNKTDGTGCNDGNPCTNNDQCNNGVCAGTPVAGCIACSTAAECPTPPGQCQQATCINNVCGVDNKPNGTTCSDGNPCTNNDQCSNGVCAGTPVAGCVTCSTAAECPTPPGQCQQATCINNVCGVDNKPNGSTCNDGNPCTNNDVCTNGVCAGTPVSGCVVCNTASECPTPANQCQQAACINNICAVTNKADGTLCNDNNACTTNDRCTNGICAGTAVVCPAGQSCCSTGSTTCTPGTCCRSTGTSCNNNGQCCSNNCTGSGSNRVCA